MKTIALIALLALVAACGAKEEATPDTGKTPEKTPDTTPDTTPDKKIAEDMNKGDDLKKSAEVLTNKAPTGGAEMRTVVLDISGMS